MLQEEQQEAPLAEALELVPEDDRGALDSTGAAALPSWLTVEGLLTSVEMGLKMWELNNINIYKLFILSSL